MKIFDFDGNEKKNFCTGYNELVYSMKFFDFDGNEKKKFLYGL